MAVNNLSIQQSNFIQYGSGQINVGTTYTEITGSFPSNYYVVVTGGANISLFVTNKTMSSFRVNSFSSPSSTLYFDYIIVA